VLTADPDLQIRPAAAPALDPDLHHLADAFLVEDRKGIVRHQADVEVLRQELGDVVPAVAVGELGQVVGPEREELGELGDLGGDQRRARHLDHRPDQILHRHARLGDDAVGDALGLAERFLHLADRPGQGDHDLGLGVDALLGDGAGGLHDGADLHAVDLGMGDPEAAAAMAEHRVGLSELLHAGDDPLEPRLLLRVDPQRFEATPGLDQLLVLLGIRQELVQRWVEQADRDREPVHGAEDAHEVVALERP